VERHNCWLYVRCMCLPVWWMMRGIRRLPPPHPASCQPASQNLRPRHFETRPRPQQDWFLKCLQAGRAHLLAAWPGFGHEQTWVTWAVKLHAVVHALAPLAVRERRLGGRRRCRRWTGRRRWAERRAWRRRRVLLPAPRALLAEELPARWTPAVLSVALRIYRQQPRYIWD
jgi:hypothetical protein